MVSSELIPAHNLALDRDSKIILLVIDGVGGLPHPISGLTELETARTPHLDALAQRGVGGLVHPIARGITPGSGVAHLSLFGYDPIKHAIGRGAVAALGVGLKPAPEDLAVRVNFATMDDSGAISDRRAGRISTQRNAELCKLLRTIKLDDVAFTIDPVKDYRAVVVFEGADLSDKLIDSDPGENGLPPRSVKPLVSGDPKAERTARMANEFIRQAREILRDLAPTNCILMRGFAHPVYLPTMQEVYKLKAGAIATYPDYLGISRMVGMDILPTGSEIADEMDTLEQHYADYDFIYFHVKKVDSAGEDGNFDEKVRIIEELDSLMPRMTRLDPDVIVVTGDHSTPATLHAHSWHPVPLILSARWSRKDGVRSFGETECARGALGQFPGTEIMALALANAERLAKFGA
ncbi:MAG: 2,3-bisphosphoglycerate-independent phosphoglycerate mutase [Candidatus Latescibacterota bacterium]